MSTSFEEMGLAAPLLQALNALNISSPTPVQAEVLPLAMQSGDLMVSSQTGSGKTFGFLLPVVHRMLNSPASPMESLSGPEVLVLCPTRELAQQVSQDAINLVKFTKGIRVATVVGGMPYGKQMASLRGARIVVGTPGRLLDLAQQRKLNLSTVGTLIVDEADRMLDLGFSEDLEEIDRLCSARIQTLMFSATFAKRITGLAENIMNAPKRIEMAAQNEANTDIAQKLMWADNRGHKRKLLNYWLDHPEMVQAVVFTSTQIDAENLARDLMDEGVRACALHGGMPQVVRNRRLASVRKGDIKVLVATDVAARGLDVPAISHVINYGMPMKSEDYVHRIGRTGRAGRSGIAVTLAEACDIVSVRGIERFINSRIPEERVEGLEPQGNFSQAPRGGKSGGGRGRPGGRPSGGNGGGERKQFGERKSFGEPRSFSDRKPFGETRSFSDRKPFEPRNTEQRPFEDRKPFQRDERRSFDDRKPSSNQSWGAPKTEGAPRKWNRDESRPSYPRSEERARPAFRAQEPSAQPKREHASGARRENAVRNTTGERGGFARRRAS